MHWAGIGNKHNTQSAESDMKPINDKSMDNDKLYRVAQK